MAKKQKKASNQKIIFLGGIGEIGKNLTVYEYEDDIIIVDCGLGFPDEDMLGIDLVIPDVGYLEKNIDKIRGIFITHGHEDHIGALPYILKTVNVPVYGTSLSLGILETKLIEHRMEKTVDLVSCKAGDVVKLGAFSVEFIRVNHSIADAVAFAIKSPAGIYVHSGDFKIDMTPIQGEMIDLTRFGELGKEGVTAFLCESTNAERPGFTPTERKVGASLEQIFKGCKKRIVIATFSSNVHRVQQIVDASKKHKRKVCIIGRSMVNIVSTALKLGYMTIAEDMLIDVDEIKKYRPDQITLITTGSQGESMSALYRMAFGTHDKVKLGIEDLVVISAHPIPGNEKTVGNIINELLMKQVEVVYDQVAEVHVSGHACQEEIKMLTALIKPRFFIPVHGEYKHLKKNAELAAYMGIPNHNILIPELGKVLEIEPKGRAAVFSSTVQSGRILIDGLGVGDVGSIVLRDRRHLSEDGLVVVVCAVDSSDKFLLSDPEIISRGFIYVKESEQMMNEVKAVAAEVCEVCFDHGYDVNSVKNQIKDEVSKLLYQKTKRRPMVLPLIMCV
ncbi:MAG: ribonuclease J [Ruminococcaceae bacterium]|nr:ribonuclease J [Oscillospiraceae bacterium]